MLDQEPQYHIPLVQVMIFSPPATYLPKPVSGPKSYILSTGHSHKEPLPDSTAVFQWREVTGAFKKSNTSKRIFLLPQLPLSQIKTRATPQSSTTHTPVAPSWPQLSTRLCIELVGPSPSEDLTLKGTDMEPPPLLVKDHKVPFSTGVRGCEVRSAEVESLQPRHIPLVLKTRPA